MPEHPFFYHGDNISDQPVKFFVSEIIRGAAMNVLREELPFSVCVEIEEFSEREFGKDYIKAKLILDRESHKKILIGKDGRMLTKIGTKSRIKIEEFLQKNIYLDLFVDVKENWKNDKSFLRTHFKKQNFIS